MATWQVVLGSGVVAAALTWGLNLYRDRQAAERDRREKHRDRILAAVADFLTADHARHAVDVEMSGQHDVVAQVAAQQIMTIGATSPASDRAQDRIIELRPTMEARTVEAEQAAARVELLDAGLGAIARKVIVAHPAPGYPPTTTPAADKHAAAVTELMTATRKVLGVPGA